MVHLRGVTHAYLDHCFMLYIPVLILLCMHTPCLSRLTPWQPDFDAAAAAVAAMDHPMSVSSTARDAVAG